MSLAGIRREISPYLDIESLLQRGALMEVGFTPTDLLHCTGAYALWEPVASEAGLSLIARQTGRTMAEMKKILLTELDVALSLGVVAKALQDDRSLAAMWGERSELLQPFLTRLLGLNGGPVAVGFQLRVPLIAVGAPSHAHLPAVADRLNCRLIVPRHAEVANAYGAISGKIVETATALIRPATPDGYLVISHNLRRFTARLEEAVQLARGHAAAEAGRLLEARGGTAVTVRLREDKTSTPLAAGWGENVLIEMRVTATATGSPAPLCPSSSTPSM
jgi:N-methylhydantoinase A/oxoprolinase/acetone carboxylase beta subunit